MLTCLVVRSRVVRSGPMTNGPVPSKLVDAVKIKTFQNPLWNIPKAACELLPFNLVF